MICNLTDSVIYHTVWTQMSQLIVRFQRLSEGTIKCSAWLRIQKPFAEMQENILRLFDVKIILHWSIVAFR